jgi:Flp pilus assembly protein TadG
MQVLKHQDRSKKGGSTIVLIIFLAFLVILPLGLLGYELGRSFLVQQELRNVCDSAALSGSAAMASAPESETYTQRQNDALTTAYNTFEQNSILQTPLNTGNVSVINDPNTIAPATPTVHHAIVSLQLLDQNGNWVAIGTPAASMLCQAYWTDAPIWGPTKLLPVASQYTIGASSNGGLPQLDIVVCMDVSGSMDDQTPARFVNRYWDVTTNPGVGQLNWNRTVANGGNPGYGNTLYNVLNLTSVGTYTGTALNFYPPQNLADASYQGTDANGTSFLWSETPNAGTFVYSHLKGLRSNTSISGFKTATMPEAGMPPGNCNPATPNVSITPAGATSNNPHLQDASGGFTDLVADMGWNSAGTSGGTSINGFSFPNVETAVEASRGNMESDAVMESACGYPGQPAKIPAILPGRGSGYFGAYYTWLLQNASPISAGRLALYNFYNTMNISSNCHLGLICFSTGIGNSPSSVFASNPPAAGDNYRIDPSYAAGGTGTFPNPACPINSADSQLTDFNTVITADDGSLTAPPLQWASNTYPLIPEGATDISDSLSAALGILTDGSADANPLNGSYRPTAKKAIVLFTDGVPNIPGGQTTASNDALAQATIAGGSNVNIPIYTIGLATNPGIVSLENNLLGTTGPPVGIAGLSGNNAIYVNVSNAAQLDQAFQTIARSLCQLQF